MRNNINNVVNIAIMITVSLMVNYLNGTFFLLMAMSVIANYVVCMRASNGIRYVVHRTFRLGVVFFFFFLVVNVRKNEETKPRIRKELFDKYRNTFVARKCERRGTFLRLSIRDCFIAVIVLFFLLRIDLIDYIDRIDSDKNQIYRNVFRSIG